MKTKPPDPAPRQGDGILDQERPLGQRRDARRPAIAEPVRGAIRCRWVSFRVIVSSLGGFRCCSSRHRSPGLAGGIGGLVAGQIDDQRGNLLGPADPPDGLARSEGRPRRRASPVASSRCCRDGLSTVPGQIAFAADDFGHKSRRRWTLSARSPRPSSRHRRSARGRDHAGRDRGHVDDRSAAVRDHARQEGAAHPVHRRHVKIQGEGPLILVAVKDGPRRDEPGAV